MTALGGLAVFVGAWLWARSGPPADANIGAGILATVGLVLTAVGALGLVIALVDRAAGRSGERRPDERA